MTPKIKPENVATAVEPLQFELLTDIQYAQRINHPTSWVREHLRPRCPDRIPSVKNGKYRRINLKDPALISWERKHFFSKN